jgi:hypothetical protein
MSDTVRKKVIEVDTGSAVKNVDNLTSSFVPLSKQIKDLKNQLAQLEQGTEEYNRVSKQLADTQQKRIEITEAAKYSNKDFGQTMSNLTNVSLGLVGGINAVAASMSLIGGDAEKMQKALVPIQLIMATIQGFSALDKALKSIQGLKNAFSEMGDAVDVAKIETVKAEVDSIPDTKVINIEVNSAQATAELAAVSTAANGVADAEGNIATKGKLVSATNKGIATTGKGIKGILGGVAKGFKTAALAVKSFLMANPILAAITAAVAAIAAGLAFLNKKMEESGRVAKEEANILSQANSAYEEQTVRLNVLLKTAQDHNQSLDERKKAVEELNKIVPDYNAQLNEETGLYTANAQALQTYLNNLKQKLQLEAYEGKIKEYLQKQLELEEEINDIQNTGWWRVKARIRARREEIAEIDKDIDRLYGKIGKIDLGAALDDNKVEDTKKNATKVVQQIKKVEDALKEMKKVASEAWDAVFDARRLNRSMRGTVSAFSTMKDTILKTMKQLNLGQVFKSQFADFINKGENSEYSAMFKDLFSFEQVFKHPNIFDELSLEAVKYAKNIEKINEKLSNKSGNLTPAQTKQFEDEKKRNEALLEDVNRRKEAYSRAYEAVEKYREEMVETQDTLVSQQRETSLLNTQLDIQRKYRDEIVSGNYLADINNTISAEEAEINSLKAMNRYIEKRIELIKSDPELYKEFYDYVKTLQQQKYENEREIASKEIQLDINKYNRRKQEAEYYYEELEKLISGKQNELENNNILAGLGTSAYNTEFEKQKIVVETIKSEMQSLEDARQQNLIGEEEYNAKMLQLKTHLLEESKKLDNARVDNAVNAVNTYVNVFQSVTSTIGTLLQSQMDMYDENSEEYKKLQIAQGWLTTLSGTLGAFMSGINSGIPAPYNLILAAAMAATTFAAGAAQIANMQNESHTNAMTSGASNVGSEYETTAYATQAEVVSSVGEQRVTVLESDISSTQNRVQVREANATF